MPGFHPVGEVEGKLPPQKERERKRKGEREREGEREERKSGKCVCFWHYDILDHFKTC